MVNLNHESCKPHKTKAIIGVIFILLTFLSNCTAEAGAFDPINFAEYNNYLKSDANINTPEEVMKNYYVFEGEGKISVTANQVGWLGWFSERYQIVLVHEGVPDDSMADYQIVMEVKKINDTTKSSGYYWQVTELKKNFRCQAGRGHTDWGIEWCN